MSKKHGGSWWQGLRWARRQARTPVDDFADMGTVFGLEASLAAAQPAQRPDGSLFAEPRGPDADLRWQAGDRPPTGGTESVAQRLKGRSVR